MSGHREPTWEKVSGIELAEIRALMLIKEVHPLQLQRILDANGVTKLEHLGCLTLRNFLHYLRSL